MVRFPDSLVSLILSLPNKPAMKKLLLILLLLPLISFGQLGEYYNAEGHPKAKGLSFKIKKPLGFE